MLPSDLDYTRVDVFLNLSTTPAHILRSSWSPIFLCVRDCRLTLMSSLICLNLSSFCPAVFCSNYLTKEMYMFYYFCERKLLLLHFMHLLMMDYKIVNHIPLFISLIRMLIYSFLADVVLLRMNFQLHVWNVKLTPINQKKIF